MYKNEKQNPKALVRVFTNQRIDTKALAWFVGTRTKAGRVLTYHDKVAKVF